MAGIYETARDLASAENKLGHEAKFVPPKGFPTKVEQDRGVQVASNGYAFEADVLINHSGIVGDLLNAGIPIVHMLHARPRGSYCLEINEKKLPVYTNIRVIGQDKRYSRFVTFWEEHVPYFENLLDDVLYIPAPVDLDAWSNVGPDGYDFGGERAEFNVAVAGIGREDSDAFHIINAFIRFARKSNKDVKLHIYAAPDHTAFSTLKWAAGDYLGEVKGKITGLQNVYRAADAVLVSHRIATRAVREALACGCKVVMAPNKNGYTPFTADPMDIDTYAEQIELALSSDVPTREVAEEKFDSKKSAEQLIEIVKQVRHKERT